MIIIYILFIILSFSSAGKFFCFERNFSKNNFFLIVFSHSNHKVRLYDIIRKTVNKSSDTLLLEVRLHQFVLPTAASSPVEEQTQSTEKIEIQKRDSWDSGEDHYFKWASLNRRPMESLAGRKRSIKLSKYRRITGGIQRRELAH